MKNLRAALAEILTATDYNKRIDQEDLKQL
jgi:hypothetical protein